MDDTRGTIERFDGQKMKPTRKQISEYMAAMGRKGGPARAASLSADRRSAIAKQAAAARWLDHTPKPK